MGSPQPLTAAAGPIGPVRSGTKGVDAQGREGTGGRGGHGEGEAGREEFGGFLAPQGLQDAPEKSGLIASAGSEKADVVPEAAVLGGPVVMAERELLPGRQGGGANAEELPAAVRTPVLALSVHPPAVAAVDEGEAVEPAPEAGAGRVAEPPPGLRAAVLFAGAEAAGAAARPDVAATSAEMNLIPSGGAGWKLVPEASAKALAPVIQGGAAVQPDAVTAQISLGMTRATGRRIEIRLDPPELGRVQIQINPAERGVHAIILAERPETGDLLRRHAEQLARDLAGAGYEDVTLEFSAGRQEADRGKDRAAEEQTFAAGFEPAMEDQEPQARRGSRSSAGGLDIRL